MADEEAPDSQEENDDLQKLQDWWKKAHPEAKKVVADGTALYPPE